MGGSNFEESYDFDELAFALTEKRGGGGELGTAMEDIGHQNKATASGDTLEIENGGTTRRLEYP
jgi:hypothetical protein